jgi:uncharacterized membrane protein
VKARLERWLDELRTGFWFVPLVMLAGAAALALFILHLDDSFDPGIHAALGWAYTGGPAGARTLLSTIAGSMITAASVTFSLASVALSIASQQYGSRVLRNFMRDRITQVLLGTFLATFLYSLLVIRAIRGSDVSGGFVPAISVTVAISLSLASIVLLVFFIHHISVSIQASRIVSVVGESTRKALDEQRCRRAKQVAPKDGELAELAVRSVTPLRIEETGYLQTLDMQRLMVVACEQDGIIELAVKPGDHVIEGDTVAHLRGGEALDAAATRRTLGAFLLGTERTPAQDFRYRFQQLTDVIVRALSPGINDPFTALNGIDELAAGLSQMSRSPWLPLAARDSKGTLRVIVPTPTVAEVLEDTVGHIAIYAAADRFVVNALRRVLSTVARQLAQPTATEQETLARLRQDLDGRERKEAS